MSVGDPNQQAALDNKQHQLLTPFNHIIGYSDLLLIDPKIRSQSAVVADLQAIGAEGRQALENLQTALAASPHSIDLTYVRPRMVTLLNQILDQVSYLEAIAAEPEQPELLSDLEKIRSAVERFLLLSAPWADEPVGKSADHEIIERLQVAAEALEAGNLEGDLLADLPSRDDALGQFTDTFQRMIQAVKAREESLKQQVQQLQAQIKENRPRRPALDAINNLFGDSSSTKSQEPIAETPAPTTESIRQKVVDLFERPAPVPTTSTGDSSSSVMDLLDLSPELNRVLRIVLHSVQISFPDLCHIIDELPDSERMTYHEIDEALNILGGRGLLLRTDEEPYIYKAQIKRKARPTQMRDVWDALGMSDNKKPTDGIS